MRSKKNDKVNYIDALINIKSYKIIYLLLIVSFIYEFIYVDNQLSYFDQFLIFRTDQQSLFLVFLTYSLSVFIVFNEIKLDLNNIVRLKSKKEYIWFVLKKEMKIAIILFCVHFLKTLIVVNLCSWMNFKLVNTWYYDFSIILYILINTIKHFGIVVMFVSLITLININYSSLIGCVSSLVLSVIIFFTPVYENNILGDKIEYFNFTNLLKHINYSGRFEFEILHYILYIFCLLVLLSFLYKRVLKKKKGILE